MSDKNALYLKGQLKNVDPAVYLVETQPNRYSEAVPVNTNGNPLANEESYIVAERTGTAKVMSAYSDDLPTVDVGTKEVTSKVRQVGNAIINSNREIEQARAFGVPLDSYKHQAAADAHDDVFNKVAWYGIEAAGLNGYLSNADIPRMTAAASGTGSATEMSAKTADLIVADLKTMKTAFVVGGKRTHRPDTLQVPTSLLIEWEAMRIEGTGITVLEFIKKGTGINNVEDYVELEADSLAEAGMDFTGGIIVMLEKKPANYDYSLLQLPRLNAPQFQNLSFKTPLDSVTGGVRVRRPLAFRIMEGVSA